jgi:membrane protein
VIDQVAGMVGRIAPGDVVAIAREQLLQITDKPHGRLLALSLVGTVWSMSSGMAALIGTLNQAHHISDGRSWWQIRATAIALTGALTLFMVLSFTLAMAGPTAAEPVANWLSLGTAFTIAWQIVRWPAAFAMA